MTRNVACVVWIGCIACLGCVGCTTGNTPGSGTGGTSGTGGAGGTAGITGPTTCGGLPAPSASCADCETSACCDVATVCSADSTCTAFEKCLAACAGDGSCRSACVVANGGSVPAAWATLEACQAAHCTDACAAGACGGYLFADDKCGECARAHCCEQAETCASDLACAQLSACIARCGEDDVCRSECRLTYDAGVEAFDKLASCEGGGDCAIDCAHNDLSCVGNVTWSASPTAPFGYAAWIFDAETGKPKPGIQLLACTRFAVSCDTPTAVASAVSDTSGHAGLWMDAQEIAWLRIDGPGDTNPVLMFFRPHVVETGLIGFLAYSKTAAAQQMASAAVIDPTAAQLNVFMVDCKNRPLAGATLEVEALGALRPVVYERTDLTPDPKMTETGLAGEARALNIPVTPADGYPLANLTVRVGGQTVAHTSVRLRSGYWSELLQLGPTPASE